MDDVSATPHSDQLTQQEPIPLSPSPLKSLDAPPPPPEPAAVRRRCKTKPTQTASPRNARKSRRRSELEIREDKDPALPEEVAILAKPRKRRQTGKTKKETPNSVPPSTPLTKSEDGNGGDLDRVGQVVSDLIMWKDVSKSTFWFGFGSLFLFSSCLTRGINFSIFSALSQLGILFLGVSFFSNSICQRNKVAEKRCEFKLTEHDILRLAKLILPALNFAISKMRALFSGEPSTTLKVVPFLLLGAEYGHLITIWRLCAIGELSASNYGCWTLGVLALTRRKYLRQHMVLQFEDGEAQVSEKEQQQALMVAEELEEKEAQHALVVREQGCQN
ncbi:hypothetical protein Fmac_019255 [Flemingia macrophylla]|uniref:Reticulon domain-containing protein n=1 Tax=Flemingia macrophylla TaxID=520843 RepID=A0ABD1M7B0_9FABA